MTGDLLAASVDNNIEQLNAIQNDSSLKDYLGENAQGEERIVSAIYFTGKTQDGFSSYDVVADGCLVSVVVKRSSSDYSVLINQEQSHCNMVNNRVISNSKEKRKTDEMVKDLDFYLEDMWS